MLDQLTSKEQHVLLELLIYTAKSDGRVRDIEAEILHQYADLAEVDFKEIAGNLKPEELVPQLESPTSRVIVLQELLRMAHLDGSFNDEERSSILDIAALMKVPMQLLQELEEWVVDGLRWVLRGDELLAEAERVVKF